MRMGVVVVRWCVILKGRLKKGVKLKEGGGYIHYHYRGGTGVVVEGVWGGGEVEGCGESVDWWVWMVERNGEGAEGVERGLSEWRGRG
jgi:hypothetical protein